MQCVEWIDCGTLPDWIVAITAIVAAVVGLRQLEALAASEAQAAAAQEAAATAQETAAAAAQSMAELAKAQSDCAEADRKQAETAAVAAENQVEIARATLLLEIDRDFESSDMREARRAVRALRNEVERVAKERLQVANDDEIDTLADTLYSEYLNKLWHDYRTADSVQRVVENDIDQLVQAHIQGSEQSDKFKPSERASMLYQRHLKLLGWLETVAHMVNQKLLPRGDILALYDQVFIEIMGGYALHIDHRRGIGTKKNDRWMIEAFRFLDSFYVRKKHQIGKETKLTGGIIGFDE